nr:redoxin family protein [Paraburkholderia sacchari]
MSGDNGTEIVNLHSLLEKKRVVLFAVPGAFTKNCSKIHFPGFVNNEASFYARGIDLIACLAVNDTNVMAAWKATFAENRILMLSDADTSYSRKIELEVDEGIEGGIRCSRFAVVINDLIVENFWVDPSGVNLSRAEAVLEHIHQERSE